MRADEQLGVDAYHAGNELRVVVRRRLLIGAGHEARHGRLERVRR
jgi:hypothetical protein